MCQCPRGLVPEPLSIFRSEHALVCIKKQHGIRVSHIHSLLYPRSLIIRNLNINAIQTVAKMCCLANTPEKKPALFLGQMLFNPQWNLPVQKLQLGMRGGGGCSPFHLTPPTGLGGRWVRLEVLSSFIRQNAYHLKGLQ